jgi:Tfp pilus assembly protein PilF
MQFNGRRSLVPVLAALIAVSLTGCASTGDAPRKFTPEERSQLLVESARAALQEGDLVGALQNLKEAEASDAKNPDVYHTRALVLYARKDLSQALAEVRRANTLKRDFSSGQVTEGKILLDLGRYKEAEIPLLQAARDPLNREAYKAFTHLGVIRYRQNRFDESVQNLDRAIELSPNQACTAYYYRGHVRLKDARYREAIRDYSSATRRSCGNFNEAHLALATAYERSRQYDLARRKYLEIQQNFANTEVAERAMERLRALP